MCQHYEGCGRYSCTSCIVVLSLDWLDKGQRIGQTQLTDSIDKQLVLLKAQRNGDKLILSMACSLRDAVFCWHKPLHAQQSVNVCGLNSPLLALPLTLRLVSCT